MWYNLSQKVVKERELLLVVFLNNMNILSKDSYIEVDDNFETKQKGIYAVGDCVFKPHYQIVIAMSEAARCALRVREDIHE